MNILSFDQQVNEIVDLLKSAKKVFIVTGAGISAESGLPTYRGISGLYNNQKTEDGLSIETVLSGSVFRQDPALTWKYISQIEEACRDKKHNRAHSILAELEKKVGKICILTQNIDGFHHQAGSTNIIDIHGDVHDLICTSCTFEKKVSDYSQIEIPPYCEKCGKMMRPNVVLFEEMLPAEKLRKLEHELSEDFDLLFTIGTTSVFPYIAQPVFLANSRNIPSVEINPDRSEVSHLVTYKITEKAVVTLERIWEKLNI